MNVEKEISRLKKRNEVLERRFNHFKERIKATEADRTRERGWFRTLIICVVIYCVALLFALITHTLHSVFISATFPVIGFAVSSLLIHFFRIRHYHKTVVKKVEELGETVSDDEKETVK